MESSHNSTRVIMIAMVLTLLSTTILCWSRYSTRAVAIEGRAREGNSKPVQSTRAEASGSANAERVNTAYGKLPLSFEANRGQTDPSVAFVSRASGSTLFLTPTSAVLALKRWPKGAVNTVNANPPPARTDAVRMRIVGANRKSQIVGREPLPGKSSYFKGNDPSNWQSSVPTYAQVEYRDLYPGVNLVYYGNEHQLEYDFVIAPGVNPSAIKLAFEGVQKISLDAGGDLVLHKAGNEIRMRKPLVYQEADGARQSVAGRYTLKGGRRIGFEIGKYDKNRELVIDPVLTYSTYLGGTSNDYGRSIAIDSAGNAYVAGHTYSFNFPVTINGYSTTYANGYDVFVTKLNADGSAIVYSTYLGGNSDDLGLGIAVDSSGNAYVTGSTGSTNYPTTPGAFQTTLHGSSYYNGDAFVTKLNVDGTALLYSTYLGGSSSEQANGIAIDSTGNAYLAGYTYSNDFPTTPGAFKTAASPGSSQEAFVTKLNDTGTALVYSTFLGGSGADQATAIKVDSSGYAYVTGMTASANFDITPGAYQSTYGGGSSSYYGYGDAFATKVDPSGTSLIYSTYIGGTGDDPSFGIDLASSGEVYLTGSTTSVNFPTTPGVVRVGNGGMAKSANGAASWSAINSGLTNSTELSLAIDSSNPNVVFVGSSGGGVFKSTNGGATWTATNSGLTDLIINALTIDSTATSKLYLGTSSRGVFRSTDSGATWRAINTGQNGMTVNTIKIDPSTATTLYAGTSVGVFKTTNGGATWAAANTGLSQSNVTSFAIDPSVSSTIYAGLSYYYGNGAYKSTDGGAHWTATSLTGVSVKALALDPSAPSTLYAATDSGVQKSTDGGANWSAASAGLANGGVNALALSPADSATIYAGTGNGIFKSTNGGTTWNLGNNGLAGAVVNTIAIDPTTALTLYSGSAGGSMDAFVTKLNATGTALNYSTYLGGSGSDQGSSIAIDASGNAYITGTTSSQNFPTTRGVFQIFGGYSNDAFVTKLNPTGTSFVYSTYLGGTDYDQGYGLVVDSSGSAYVTGYTQSQNFPITTGAFQSVKNGYNTDAFITKVAVVPSLTADLGVTVTASSGPFNANSFVSYSIVVTNNGPDAANSIVVSDILPSSLTFSSCSSCTHSGNSATFAINSLDVGASVNLQIYTYVSCTIPSSAMIDNTITVDSSATDPHPADNSATATISATNPPPTINTTNQTFPSSGGSSSVNVSSSTSCGWTSTSNATWITISYSSNCCNGFVNYSVAANPGIVRQGTITIAGQTFTVDQGSGCMFSIDHSSKSFMSAGGADSVAVTTSDASCNWNATTNATFITITSGNSGSGNGTVNYSVDPNPAGIPRSGTMTIAGQTFTVNETEAPCTFTLGSPGQSYSAPGGSGSVGVTAPNGCNWTAVRNDGWITITSGSSGSGNGSVGYTVAVNSGPPRTGSMTIAGQTFTVNQSAGIATAGLYDPGHAAFFLRNSNSGGVADISFTYGPTGTGFIPLVGDWNGDGVETIGLYDPAHAAFFLRNSNTSGIADISFTYGPAGLGFIPLVGDWNGDGVDTVGLYDPAHAAFFLRNSNTGGIADISFTYGPAGLGFVPIVGDWNGDGIDTIGLYDPSHAAFFLRNSNSGGIADITFTYGPAGSGLIPLVGDWNADGIDSIGLYNPATAAFFLRNSNTGGIADISFTYGPAGLGFKPLTGDWDGL
jgi:uncharacterized repeat protein (TIGR01451 family)